MSIISSKNKLQQSKLESIKNTQDISRIITVDFNKKPAHYFNYGYRKFNIISKTTLIIKNTSQYQTNVFKFNGVNENIVPFIKVIPRLEVFLEKNKEYIDINIRYEWSKLAEDKLSLTTYLYYRLTPYYGEFGIPSSTQFNLYYSLDMAIKSRLGVSLTHGTQL